LDSLSGKKAHEYLEAYAVGACETQQFAQSPELQAPQLENETKALALRVRTPNTESPPTPRASPTTRYDPNSKHEQPKRLNTVCPNTHYEKSLVKTEHTD